MPNGTDNNWVLKFFELIGQSRSTRSYRCMTCDCIVQTRDGKEIDEKCTDHLRGKCRKNGEL
jgi:hypothetical protein